MKANMTQAIQVWYVHNPTGGKLENKSRGRANDFLGLSRGAEWQESLATKKEKSNKTTTIVEIAAPSSVGSREVNP